MISALDFKPFDRGSLRGFLDLRYHGLTIKGCRLMTGSNGLWVALPQKQAEQYGKPKYYDQMYLTPPEADHVRRLIIADLQTQGHIQSPDHVHHGGHGKGHGHGQQRPPQHRNPEGDDLSEHFTKGAEDDIPF